MGFNFEHKIQTMEFTKFSPEPLRVLIGVRKAKEENDDAEQIIQFEWETRTGRKNGFETFT